MLAWRGVSGATAGAIPGRAPDAVAGATPGRLARAVGGLLVSGSVMIAAHAADPLAMGVAGTAGAVGTAGTARQSGGAGVAASAAPAAQAAPLDELRVVLGNPVAVEAIRRGTLPFPDGAILVKLAYRKAPSADFAPATVPGAPTTVQVMEKDARRWPGSGGWGYGRFIGGVPADAAQHQTCFACHAARVAERDFVFTRFAP
ncbi:MAG: hypothetical protein GAK40_01045 [Burkholderia plantarii]|nr:MAG: hypothetical protein GAK40_01045 [Burkholderia plantarii]